MENQPIRLIDRVRGFIKRLDESTKVAVPDARPVPFNDSALGLVATDSTLPTIEGATNPTNKVWRKILSQAREIDVKSQRLNLNPQIKPLILYSIEEILTDKMEKDDKKGVDFSPIREAIAKNRRVYVQTNFNGRLGIRLLNQTITGEMAQIIFDMFYRKNPQDKQIFGENNDELWKLRNQLDNLIVDNVTIPGSRSQRQENPEEEPTNVIYIKDKPTTA